MGNRPIQILLKQREIKANRSVEYFDKRMQALLEAITPSAVGAACHPTSHRFSHQYPQLVRRKVARPKAMEPPCLAV